MVQEVLQRFPPAARTFLSRCLAGSVSSPVRQLISEALEKSRGCETVASALTPQQLCQLACQIAVLRCILQRQAVAALLERDAALVAELAQDAEKHGPLALLHLPLSEYKPVEPEGGRQKKRWRQRRQTKLDSETLESSDGDEEPVIVSVVSESVQLPAEAAPLVPLVPLVPLSPPRFRRSRKIPRTRATRTMRAGLENADLTVGPTATEKQESPPKRKPGRPRKGCEPDIPRQPRKLDLRLPSPPMLKQRRRPCKHPLPLTSPPEQGRAQAEMLPGSRDHPLSRPGYNQPAQEGLVVQQQKQLCKRKSDGQPARTSRLQGTRARAAEPPSHCTALGPDPCTGPSARLESSKATSPSTQQANPGAGESSQRQIDCLAGSGEAILQMHGRQEAGLRHQVLTPSLEHGQGLLDLRQDRSALNIAGVAARELQAVKSSAAAKAIQGCRMVLESEESEHSSSTSRSEEDDILSHDDEDGAESTESSSEEECSDNEGENTINASSNRSGHPCKHKSELYLPKSQPQSASLATTKPARQKQQAQPKQKQPGSKVTAKGKGRPAASPALPPRLPLLKPVRLPPVLEEDNFCSVCGDEDGDDPENKVLLCEGAGCQVAVHQQCYGLTCLPSSRWLCDGCAAGVAPSSNACVLCPCSGGALRTVTSLGPVQLPYLGASISSSSYDPAANQALSRTVAQRSELSIRGRPVPELWAHSACVLWTLGAEFRDPERLADVDLGALTQRQLQFTCSLCNQGGAVVQCSFEKCSTGFHPLCARSQGHILPIADSATCLAFCGLHSHDKYAKERDRMVAETP